MSTRLYCRSMMRPDFGATKPSPEHWIVIKFTICYWCWNRAEVRSANVQIYTYRMTYDPWYVRKSLYSNCTCTLGSPSLSLYNTYVGYRRMIYDTLGDNVEALLDSLTNLQSLVGPKRSLIITNNNLDKIAQIVNWQSTMSSLLNDSW